VKYQFGKCINGLCRLSKITWT